MRALFLIGLLSSVSIPAFPASAEPIGRWWTGWGMGTTEFGFTIDERNSIYIGCSEDHPLKISIKSKGKSPRPGSQVRFRVNGQSVDWRADSRGDLPTNSRVEADNFTFLIEEIRRGTGFMAVEFDSQTIQFPLRGSSRALADAASACTPTFWR